LHHILKALRALARRLEKVEEKTKPVFVIVAIVFYIGCLIKLTGEINPITDFDHFLIKALAKLSVPFGIILLQEMLELLTAVPRSALQSACQQFELIALVILRSFFKDFYKLSNAIAEGEFSEPVQVAVMKVLSLVAITYLITVFNRLSKRAGVERQSTAQLNTNHLRQLFVLCLYAAAAVYVAAQSGWPFDIMQFIRIVFTGMIVLDALFFLGMMSKNDEFDSLMFDGNLVVSLIFARFPLFAANLVAFPMAVIGVALATGGLRLFIRPTELRFLDNPQEDDVARLELTIQNQMSELEQVNTQTARFLKQLNVADEVVRKVRLSCEELLSNTIQFAYDDKGSHDIGIGLALCGNRLAITILDDGKPFNPFRQNVPDIDTSLTEREVGGLGIYLVRSMMNKVAYHRQTGKNVITLLIYLDGQKNLPAEESS